MNTWQIPLMDAASRGDLDGIKAHLGDVPHVDVQERGWSALQLAIHKGHGPAALALLEAGASASQTNSGHYTPLWRASVRGMEAVAAALLERGADVDAQDMEDGKSPLIIASLRGHVGLVKVLLGAGASLSAMTHQGMTALEAAQRACQIRKGQAAERAQEVLALLTAAVDSAVAKNDPEAARVAAACGRLEAIERLLGAEVDCDAPGPWNQTALVLAAVQGHADVVARLLEAGAQWQRPTVRRIHFERVKLGDDALWWAVARDRAEVVRVLASGGADLQRTDAWANTALHHAAQAGKLQAAQALLDAGASPQVVNRRGQKPVDVAREGSFEALAELLSAD